MFYDQITTGHWNALFIIQGKYGHGLHSPIEMFLFHFRRLFSEFKLETWIEIQNMIATFLVFIFAFLFIKKRHENPKYVFYGLFLLIFWILPYCAGRDSSLYRGASMLGIIYPLYKQLPTWSAAFILLIFLILAVPMGKLFILSIII